MQHVEPRAPREKDVEDDELRAMVPHRRDGFVAPGDQPDVIAFVTKVVDESSGQGGLVLHQEQHRFHGAASAPGGTIGRTSVKVDPSASRVTRSTRPP